MLVSKQLGLLSNVLSLSAVIMALASVITSTGMDDLRLTALVGFAATMVAAVVGYQAFSNRGERLDRVAIAAPGPLAEAGASDRALILYASGEKPPKDAKIGEVNLGGTTMGQGRAL